MRMIPIVSVIGESDSGKTTLIEKLIPELKKLGLRVGTLKHDARGHAADVEGKDSWRHARAGAAVSAVASERQVSVVVPVGKLPAIDAIVDAHFNAVDIVITEGFKAEDKPKIEVFRKGHSGKWHARRDELIAVVTDEQPPSGVPAFRMDEAARLAEFLNEKFFKSVSKSDVRVWADGETLQLNPFVKAFVGQTVKGMMNALKGGKNRERIRIKIGR
jgi:molybdopterin-guanine dinucleotide biosynthesis adapter protein